MIVSPPNYVLSLPPTVSPDAPVIGYHSIVTIGNVTASGGAKDDYPVTNLANPATNLRWEASSTADQYLQVSGIEGEIDYIGIAGHNFGTHGFSVYAEASFDGGDTWETVAGPVIQANNQPLVFLFTEIAPTDVRVQIEADGVAEPYAAVLHVGKALRCQRNIYVGHTPITYARKIKANNGRSESGHFLGRIVTGRRAETSVTFQNLTPDWYREYFHPFVEHAETGCFFFAWRPAEYPTEVGYAWLTDDPMPSNTGPNGFMQVNLTMSGMLL